MNDKIKDLYNKKTKFSSRDKVLNSLKKTSLTVEDINILENWEGEGAVKGGESKTGILHEFFTPYWLCYIIGEIVKQLGINYPKVIDPAIGTGRIINNIHYRKLVGFEVNEFNYKIASKLYYGSDTVIYNQAFETAFLNPPRYNSLAQKSWLGNDFDLVVSNPPYGEYAGEYKTYMPKIFTRFECLFVFLSMKLLKKQGYGLFILPQSFMNNGNMYNRQKEEIMKYSNFIDAIRFPNGIFKSTDIGVDLLILQKK
jgi:type I restriction-modification system DNA methylase subunit